MTEKQEPINLSFQLRREHKIQKVIWLQVINLCNSLHSWSCVQTQPSKALLSKEKDWPWWLWTPSALSWWHPSAQSSDQETSYKQWSWARQQQSKPMFHGLKQTCKGKERFVSHLYFPFVFTTWTQGPPREIFPQI